MQYPNGIETTYGYDARHRLTDISTADIATSTPIVSFGYTLDSEGERTQVLEADGTVRQYGYDSIARLTSESVTGSLTYAKQFAYDAVGNRQTQVTTGSGAGSVTYAYDSRDRLTTENATAYGYDANGNVTSKAGEASYQWDFENRLSDVTLSSGALVSHQYDPDGNRVQTSVSPAATGAIACGGPSGSFLKIDTTTEGNWPGVYGSDGEAINAETPALPSYAGLTFTNASSFTWSANPSSPHALELPPPSTSRIASTWYSGTSMTLHVAVSDGNAHTVAFYLLDWNGENITETITAQTTGGVVLDAARPYGGFTQGVWAVYQVCGDVDFVFTRTGTGGNAVVSGVFFGAPVGTATVDNLLVDTAGCPSCGGGGGLSQNVAETDGNGNLTALYVRNRDQLLAVMRPGSSPGTWRTRFIHGDGLGSVRALTDETATTIDTRGYEAFGTKNVEAGSDPLAYGFAGEPFQSDSMLAYHRARWMDARVGRFEGMDQVDGDEQNPLSLHRYIYASDQPTTRTDPSGKDDLAGGFGSISDIGQVAETFFRSLANYILQNAVPLYIDAISARVATAGGDPMTNTGNVYYQDPGDLADKTIATAGGRNIEVLSVYDHGASTGIDFGTQIVSPVTFSLYESAFARLKNHFTAEGHITLNACDAASDSNQAVLMQISQAVGVPVFGGSGETCELAVGYPGSGPSFNTGTSYACDATHCIPVSDPNLTGPYF